MLPRITGKFIGLSHLHPVLRECHLLRNFTKRASGFQWLKQLDQNGFSTASPLRQHLMEDVDGIVAISSLLLSWKALGHQNKQQLGPTLSKVEELSGLNVDIDATAECVERVRQLDQR
ncbi:uncharacterized protein ATC70_010050 [Mucor velutinosus]|uniref:Uncharacterized protein n=1 Tax=Mucor velutinosus TaxID=708070 RepID=A0AAN7DNA7_9FUNG|nr:hypothetical protein ATC70_010050 [Mucor velutinosus]